MDRTRVAIVRSVDLRTGIGKVIVWVWKEQVEESILEAMVLVDSTKWAEDFRYDWMCGCLGISLWYVQRSNGALVKETCMVSGIGSRLAAF